jgi:glycosyltransferase involved in cell wall biosynthesis
LKGVSVIICCYNSASRLPQTLKHLALQKVTAHIPWEVIIVNNASKDDTVKVALSQWDELQTSNSNFKIVDQPIAGLSYARAKGAETAAYEYLVFCDDDNWLFENYVETAYNLLESWPNCGIAGGHGSAKLEGDAPEWFEKYHGYYATGQQSSQDGIIEGVSPYVYGAGSVVRKSVLDQLNQINFKPLATDRLNDKLSSGGDVEICYAFKLLNYDICYSSELRFFHFIPQNRLANNYLLSLAYQFGYCNILHRPYFWLFNPHMPSYKKTWLWTLAISTNIYLISLKNSYKKTKSLDAFIAKVNLEHAKGRLTAILKLTSSIEQSYKMLVTKFKTSSSA